MSTQIGNKLSDLIQHLFPAIALIAIFEILAIRVYSFGSSGPVISFNFWIIAQTVGALCWGNISDHYCRKKSLLATQFLGVIAICLLIYLEVSNYLIWFLGIAFSPSPIARSALIDNFPRKSKLQIIGITFLAQFLPWCFFIQIANANYTSVMMFSVVAVAMNLIITALFFSDRRDEVRHPSTAFFGQMKQTFSNKKSLFTLLALLPPEISFFLSDYFFEKLENNDSFFSALGIGCLIGTSMSLFYRRTPHISVLTTAYALGGVLSLVYLISLLILPFEESLNLNFQLMLLSVLGGFYLPFVYDVVLTSTSSNYRGTACALVELVCFSGALFGAAIMLVFSPSPLHILVLITLFFIIASIFQKKSETIKP